MYNFAQHPPQCHNTRPKAIGREFVRPAAAKHRQPGQGPAQARPAARAEPAARSAHITRRTHAARLVYHCRAPRARPARCSRRPCRPSRRLPSSPLQRPRGDQRARHARSVRQSSAHPQPACARHGCQLATRPRAELQRAARARVGHPAGAAAAAAAAAACPGARGAAVPARAPRLTRALDALHVWDACPALALAQGAALRAFPRDWAPHGTACAGQQQQAAVQARTRHFTRARHPTRSSVVPPAGGRWAASLGCPGSPRRHHQKSLAWPAQLLSAVQIVSSRFIEQRSSYVYAYANQVIKINAYKLK